MLLSLATACGGTEMTDSAAERVDRRVAVPAAPERGLQVMLPEMVWEASSEKQLCWFTTLPITEPVLVQGFQPFQGAGGHHVIVFSTHEDVPDGAVEDCTDGTRMKYWQLVFTPVEAATGVKLPEGYAIEVQPGTKLVFQVHYINPTAKQALVRDVVNLTYHAPSPNIVKVAPFATGVVDYVIPPRTPFTAKYECPVSEDMNVFMAFGHMHENGSSIVAQVGKAGRPDTMSDVYRVDRWEAQFRDTPPLARWPFESPLRLGRDDVLRVACTWQTDEDQPLGFPQEMCAAVLWFYPAARAITCTGTDIP